MRQLDRATAVPLEVVHIVIHVKIRGPTHGIPLTALCFHQLAASEITKLMRIIATKGVWWKRVPAGDSASVRCFEDERGR